MSYRPRDRGSAIELTLELLATGTVAGIAPDHDPAELERALGPPSDEGIATFSGNLVRDWGVLEAYYERTGGDAPWRGTLLMGQLHRMPKPLKWRPIARELRTLGYELTPVPKPTLDDSYFRVAESSSEAVVNGRNTSRHFPYGHIAKISAADWLPLRVPFLTYDFNDVRRAVSQAAGRPDHTWLAGVQPHLEWFHLAHAALHTIARERPERTPEVTALHDWLLTRSPEVWSPTEQALAAARCAANSFFVPLPGSRATDPLIDRCLAVLPLSRAEAQSLPTAWRDLAPRDVQRSKLARALLQAANQLRTEATAPGLTAELTAWQTALPRLC